MKYKQFILCAALLIQVFAVFGQRSWTRSAGTVSYSLLESDPDKYKRTVLYIELFGADTYFDASMGSNFKLETMLGDRIMVAGQLRHSWFDIAATHVVSGYPQTAGGLQKQLITDVGGVYYFRSKKKKVSVKVVLSSSTSGRYTTTHSVSVPSEVRRMAGIRGGLFYDRKALVFGETSHATFHYKSDDGLIVVPIANVGTFGYVQPAGEAYQPIAMSHVASIYCGIHSRNIKNTVIRAEGYGKKRNAKVIDLYFDLMYAPSITIDKVTDIDGKVWEVVPQDGALRHLGYRIGYAFHTSKYVGITFSSEFGKRPGAILGKSFLNNGTFVTFNMGLSIGSGKYLKLKHEAKKKDETTEGAK